MESISYNNLGVISRAEGNLGEAKEWYRKSLELFEELSRETGTVESLDGYAASCFNLGAIDRNHLDVALLRKAESIWNQLAQSSPKVARYVKNLKTVQEILNKIE